MPTLCASPLVPDTRYGELTVNGVSLHQPWWNLIDLSELYASPATRGGNPLVESIPGRPAAPTLSDQLSCSLELVFSGALSPDNAPYANPFEGLLRNRQALHQAIIAPFTDGSASTLDATLTLPGQTTPTPFQIQTLEFFGWALLPKGLARTVLRVIVPDPSQLHTLYA